jgi:hypothetical protein
MVRELLLKLFNRRNAYCKCFKDGTEVSDSGRRVLKDLAKFCRAHDTTTLISPISRMVDPLASAQAEGRREVFLRIMWHLKLTDADLMTLKEIEE